MQACPARRGILSTHEQPISLKGYLSDLPNVVKRRVASLYKEGVHDVSQQGFFSTKPRF